jgi:zinc finger protein
MFGLDVKTSRIMEINTMMIKCPACNNNTLRITDYLYDMPRVGKVILTVGKCSRCNYKFNDIRLAEARGPRKIVFRIENTDDVDVLVIKASSASVIIKEIGLKMLPGPASQGFISTIEGVLQRFKEAVEIACKSPDANQSKCKQLISLLDRAREGKEKLTIIVVDPEGVSAIESPKARVEEVTREELEELGYIVQPSD